MLFLDIAENIYFLLDEPLKNYAVACNMIFRVEHALGRSFPTSATSAKFIQSATR